MIQANLNIDAALREKFDAAQSPDGARTIVVKIKHEQLIYHSSMKKSGDEAADFAAIVSDVSDAEPSFYLFNRAAGTANAEAWAVIAYVPELSPVRQRMLYASSRDDLKIKLGTSFFTGEFYCNDKADLTMSNFEYALEGINPDVLESVMTEKELLLKEESMSAAASGVSSAGMGVVPFKFTPELGVAMKAFAANERKAVEIRVNSKTEICQLGKLDGETTLEQLEKSFPNDARFFCLNYSCKVFVFFCPDHAKVRVKMLMATCKSSVIGQTFDAYGIKFDKQVEIRGADELRCNFAAASAAAVADTSEKQNLKKVARKTRGKRRLIKKKFQW